MSDERIVTFEVGPVRGPSIGRRQRRRTVLAIEDRGRRGW
jgi:hypothetical protein